MCSLPWFPHWLPQVKALVSFLYVATTVSELMQAMKKAGAPEVAAMLAQLKSPPIATWRWRTLGDACIALVPPLDSLIVNFDPSPFPQQGGLRAGRPCCGGVRYQGIAPTLRAHLVVHKLARWNYGVGPAGANVVLARLPGPRAHAPGRAAG